MWLLCKVNYIEDSDYNENVEVTTTLRLYSEKSHALSDLKDLTEGADKDDFFKLIEFGPAEGPFYRPIKNLIYREVKVTSVTFELQES